MRGASTQLRVVLGTILCLLFATAPSLAVSPEAPSKADDKSTLIVHEWGTFLSVQGSDGVTLGGMVDNDEALPAFVETRSIANWNRSRFRVKGETPVTYFYTDRPRAVQVRVEMPEGVLTHWYPNVCRFGPSPLQNGPGAPRNSFLDWCIVTLLPQSERGTDLRTEIIVTKKGEAFTGIVAAETPRTIELLQPYNRGARTIEKKDIEERAIAKKQISTATLLPVGTEQTWRYVRQTDSALVKVDNFDARNEPVVQFEKFLFYRGVGTFPMPLDIRSSEDPDVGLRLHLSNKNEHAVKGIFGIRVDNETIQFARIDDLAGKTSQDIALDARLAAPVPLNVGVPQIKSAVAAALVGAGLYEKEAQAMVNTWDRSYFRSEGLRVLYLVPRERVDAVLPIHIRPAPDKLVRVMVGRIEVLTPTREKQIEGFVLNLGANDFKVREAASAGLARLGRLGEPALRRVLATSADPEVRARAQSIINRSASAN